MTTDAGRPVGDNQNSLTVGPRGPIVFDDFLLFEKMAHFNRERIPERVVHAKGSGAHGTFTVQPDITKYTKAKLFDTSARRRRLRPLLHCRRREGLGRHRARSPRLRLKFYTEEGNWDMVGNNTPVFFIRDPLKFGDFIHTQKRDPADQPEVAHHDVGLLVALAGVAAPGHHPVQRPRHPDGYRHMDGFSSHTFA